MQEPNSTETPKVPDESATALDNTQVKTVPYTAPKVSMQGFMQAMQSALRAGDITATEAAQLRSRLGISKRQFTKKKSNFAKTKRKAQLAKKARRIQRDRNTLKGAKVSGGKHA